MKYFLLFAQEIIDNYIAIYFALVFILFLAQYISVKKHIYSLLDPLFVFIFFNSFAWASVFVFSYSNHDFQPFYDITAMNICFVLPAFFVKPLSISKLNRVLNLRTRRFDFQVFYVFAFILFISTLVLWVMRGIPLFSGNPDRAKIMLYAGGFGLVRYIHFVTPLFCIFFSLFCLIYRKYGALKNLVLAFISPSARLKPPSLDG